MQRLLYQFTMKFWGKDPHGVLKQGHQKLLELYMQKIRCTNFQVKGCWIEKLKNTMLFLGLVPYFDSQLHVITTLTNTQC
jgi:hypothetical protein